MNEPIDFKAMVPLDGQEMQIIADALIHRASELIRQGKGYQSAVNIMVATKIQNEKRSFHQQHSNRIGNIYGFKNKKSQL